MQNPKQPDISRKGILAWRQIERVLDRGYDAEVRKTKDGSIRIFELRKSPVPVE